MQRHWIILLAVVMFVAGLWLAPTVYRWRHASEPAGGAGRTTMVPYMVSTPDLGDRDLPQLSELYEGLSPSVVNISVMVAQPRTTWGIDSTQPYRESRGSGFILTPDGSVVTNQHVVAGARRVQVRLADGAVFPASVVGTHQATDLALLQIESDGPLDLQPAVLGNSDDLRVGEWVFAIGNPFGLNHSLTTGIVSYIGRPTGDEHLLFDFIQTDTAINPGNSGGPLFNLAGEVVGINSAILGDAEGIGFSIPIDVAKIVVPVLRESGEFQRGYLGVYLAADPPAGDVAGVSIARVLEGTPAADASLAQGDVLLSFDGQPIVDPRDLPRTVGLTQPGSAVPVEIARDGETFVVTVVVGNYQALRAAQQAEIPSLGITVRPADEDDRRRARLASGGLVVVSVTPGGPAARNLLPGDVIVELDYEPISSSEDFANQIQGPDRHLLLVSRGGRVFPLWVR